MSALNERRESEENDDADIVHSARIIADQIGAIATWLDFGKVKLETKAYFGSIKRKPAGDVDFAVARKWLTNAWSTEYFLSNITDDLGADVAAYAVHWAFPQAYYAVYAQRMAHSVIQGHKEDAHQKVIKRFGYDAKANRLPTSLSICVTGVRNDLEHYGISVIPNFNTDTRLRRRDPNSVIGYVGSALRGTRQFDLNRVRKERSKDFLTAKGQPSKKLGKEQWREIETAIGPTSILSYLYRKRLKANYDNVDALHSDVIDAPVLLRDVRSIVRSFALVHESLIVCKLGRKSFEKMTHRVPKQVFEMHLSRRDEVYDCALL